MKLLSFFETSLRNINESSSNKEKMGVHDLIGMVIEDWCKLSKETDNLVKVKFILWNSFYRAT